MTLVLLTPIDLEGGCWEHVPLADVATVKHVFSGFGGRPRAAEQPTMASLADEIADCDAGTLDVAGVSLGGMVAQHPAVRRPRRVRSLRAGCTGAAAEGATMSRRAGGAQSGGMAAVLQTTPERWFTPAARAALPESPGARPMRSARCTRSSPHASPTAGAR